MANKDRSDSPHEVDFSVIRTSIDMGHSMIDQILNGIHYGSIEIQNYLYEECDFIMECKVCRNLFRSFPNFVAHKRVYCVDKYKEKVEREKSMVIQSEEEVVVVQPEISSNQSSPSSLVSDSSVVQKVIENRFSGKSREYQFYTQVAESMEQKRAGKVTSTVVMSAIPTNPNAMVVTHADGDQSEEIAAQLISQQKNRIVPSDTPTSRAQQSSIRTAQQPKSIGDICKKLATQQRKDIPRVSEMGLTRKSRKSVPQKSTEDSVTFNPKPDTTKSKPNAARTSPSEKKIEKNSPPGKLNERNRIGPKVPEVASDMGKSITNVNFDIKDYMDDDKIKCNQCSANFETIYNLKIHLAIKHDVKVGEYACPKCTRYYASWKNVMRHLRIGHHATPGVLKRYRESVTKGNVPMKFTRNFEDRVEPVNTKSELFKALTGNIDTVVTQKEFVVIGDTTKKIQGRFQKPAVDFKWSQKQITVPIDKSNPAQNKPITSESNENNRSVTRTLKNLGAMDTTTKNVNLLSERATTRIQRTASDETVRVKNISNPVSKSDNANDEMSESEPMETEQTLDVSASDDEKPVPSKKYTTRLNKETASAVGKEPASSKETGRLKKEAPFTAGRELRVNKDASATAGREPRLNKENPANSGREPGVNRDTTGREPRLNKENPATSGREPRANQEIPVTEGMEPDFTKSGSIPSVAGQNIKAEKDDQRSLKKYPTRHSVDNQKIALQETEQSNTVDKAKSVSNNKSVIKVTNDNQKDARDSESFKAVEKNTKVSDTKLVEKINDSKDEGKASNAVERQSRNSIKAVKDTKSVNLRSSSNDSVDKVGKDTDKNRNKSEERKSMSKPRRQSSTVSESSVSKVTLGSPDRISAPFSPPNSPTLSINSNSGDGYSSKFKMSVKEMAELIENATLTKFANDRKKRARKILTDKESKNMGGIPKKLVKPMKKRVGARRLPMKRVYSTRLSTDKLGDRLQTRTGRNVSKRLEREMKRLANSAGLVESNIYSSSAPAVSTKESDSSSEKTTKDKGVSNVPMKNIQTKQINSEKPGTLKMIIKTSQPGSRSSSKDRNIVQAKSEDKPDSRNSSTERGRISSSERGRTSSNERGRMSSNERSRTSSNERDRTSSSERAKVHTISQQGDQGRGRSLDKTLLVGARQPELIIRDIHGPKSIADRARAAAKAEALEELFKKKTQAAMKSVTNDIKSSDRKDSDKMESSSSLNSSMNTDSDDSKSDSHNHRTRLSTGSIYFNSELLKLSPSKASTAEGKLIRPSRDDSTTVPKVPSLKRKLSLSPKHDQPMVRTLEYRQKVFPLSTGVKRCGGCGKVFWKLKTFSKHKCPQNSKIRNKKMMNLISPENSDSESNSNAQNPSKTQIKRARMEDNKIDKSDIQSSLSIETEKQNGSVEIDKNEKVVSSPSKQKQSPKKNTNQHSPIFSSPDKQSLIKSVKQHSPIFLKSVHSAKNNVNRDSPILSTPAVIDSDNESEFSGFSESDIHERVEELQEVRQHQQRDHHFDDLAGDDVDGLSSSEVDSGDSDIEKMFGASPDDEGLVYKSAGKKKNKCGTVEEIWVEKPKTSTSEEKVHVRFKQYVQDPSDPTKIHCWRNQHIEELINEKDMTCLQCNMQYSTISNLRRHVIRHLGWKRYLCNICMLSCYSKADCRQHYSRSHNKNLDNYKFSDCYKDLKQEASHVRNRKRVMTMRSRKEQKFDDDFYKKPRSSLVNSRRTSAGVSNTSLVEDATEKGNMSESANSSQPSKLSEENMKSVKLDMKDFAQSKSSDTESGSHLSKARLNLANVLNKC